MPNHHIQERFPRCRVRLSQPASYITLENALLTLPPAQNQAALSAVSAIDYEPLPDGFASSV